MVYPYFIGGLVAFGAGIVSCVGGVTGLCPIFAGAGVLGIAIGVHNGCARLAALQRR